MNLVDIARGNLLRRKGKMAFLLAGLSIGVATIVALVGLTGALTREAEHQLENYGANILITPKSDALSLSYGGITLGGVNLEPQPLRFSDLHQIGTIDNFQNIATIAPKVLGAAETGKERLLVMGVVPEKEFLLKRWWQVDGRPLAADNEAVAGANVARRLGLAAGSSVTLSGQTLQITGLLAPTGSQDDDLLLVTLATGQKLFGKEGYVSLVEVAALCSGCPIEDIVNQIAAVLPNAEVKAIQQVVQTRMHALEQFELFAWGVSGIVLLIGSLVVFVTMMGSVNERTREIGIFRALGFRRSHVVSLILLEAFAVSLLAGIIGYLTGSGTARLVLPLFGAMHPAPLWNPLLAGGALTLAVTIGLLAALYPSLHASRMDPTEALRSL